MSTYTIPIKLSHLILVGIGYITGKAIQKIHDEVYISRMTFEMANQTIDQALVIAGVEGRLDKVTSKENTEDADGR